jgi:D-sedoheptulose 7-phosphate isomerase
MHLEARQALFERISRDMPPLMAAMATQLAEAFRNGNKLLVMGNGGSAADAQHLAAEIVGRFKMERRALPAISLSTDTSILTAVGNDYGFETIFRRQVDALALADDVVLGISTSGNSPNVRSALELARERGCRTMGLLGGDGGRIRELCDLALVIPSSDTPAIQEGHITIIHIVCDQVEKELFGGGAS